MAFIKLTEALPKETGIYRVMVESVDKKAHEAKATWSMEEGFHLIDKSLEEDAHIVSWWTEDNIR